MVGTCFVAMSLNSKIRQRVTKPTKWWWLPDGVGLNDIPPRFRKTPYAASRLAPKWPRNAKKTPCGDLPLQLAERRTGSQYCGSYGVGKSTISRIRLAT